MTRAIPVPLSRFAIVPAALILALACAHKADDCTFIKTCGDYEPDSGQGGWSLSSSGGADSGGLSSVGGVPTTGGASTTTGGFVSACTPACTGAKPVCNESAKTCVECLTNGNCPTSKPACNAATNTCVGCMLDSYCSKPTPACNLATYSCVGCTKDDYCSSPTPACNTTTNQCVQCTKDAHCAAPTPACSTTTNVCVQCTGNANCPSSAPLCDTPKNTCVECLSNADCKSPLASTCVNGACEPCSSNADCTHLSGKGVCKTSAPSDGDAGVDASTDAGPSDGECVQCTGTQYSACGQSNGKSLVCDSLTNTCSTTATAQSAGLCQPCISDAQCTAGKLCYEETFGGRPVGHFCFWKQGDTANGAPAGCSLQSNRPYAKTEKDVTSIDGEMATLCTLAASTCTAYNQFRDVDCAPTGTPQDSLCGFAPGADSKCALYDSALGVYRCTTVCASNDDCKFSCNTGVSPNICNFQ